MLQVLRSHDDYSQKLTNMALFASFNDTSHHNTTTQTSTPTFAVMVPANSQHIPSDSPALLPYDMLALVNERLFNPSPKEKPCNLHNYFLGYREHMETPPSPTHTDADSLLYQNEYYSATNEVQSSQSTTLVDSAPTTIPSPALSDLDPSSSDDESHAQYHRDQHSFKRAFINQTPALSALSRPYRSVAGWKARQGMRAIFVMFLC